MTQIQMYKGWTFVTVTALLIFMLLLRPMRHWDSEAQKRQTLLKALAASEERLRHLLEGLPHLVWTCSANGACDYFSPQWVRYTGVSEQAQMRAGWFEQVHQEDRTKAIASWQHASELGILFDHELRIRRKDGEYHWFQVRAVPIRDNGERILKWFGSASDVTDRKVAEEHLRNAQARLTSTLEAGGIGTWELDLTTQQGSWDEALTQLFGRSPDDGAGMDDFFQHVHEEDRQALLDAPEKADASNRMNARFRYIRPDGRVLTLVSRGRVERDAKGTVVRLAGATVDVTETARLEERLRQAQKMETVGQLAGGIAHDFNNLLTVITGYGDLLVGSFANSDPRRGHALNILKAGERASGLTRQLLAFSRKQVLEPKVLDLNRIVRNTERMLERLIGEDIHLTTKLQEGIGAVKVDPGQIDQVILNLAVNARDAMPQGGWLTLETGRTRLDEEYCRLNTDASPGNYAFVALSDTGFGMPPETIARIFEPFFTTKGRSKGTGLGLATVYGIVKQSEGHIEVQSEPGKGTCFKVYLPVVEGPVESEDEEPVSSALTGSETILLTEDEENVREICRTALEAQGYTVLTAANGQEAVALAERHTGRIDLLLTDVVMPLMSGRQLSEELRQKLPDLKVMFMSGYLDDAKIRHGIGEAYVNFINKPFKPGTLARKIREVLDAQ